MNTQMRWFTLIIFIIFPLHSVEARTGFDFSIQTGVSVPRSPWIFADYWKPGPTISAGATHQLGSQLFQIQMQMGYSRFGLDRAKLMSFLQRADLAASVATSPVHILTLLAGFKIEPFLTRAKLAPFLVVDGGYLYQRSNGSSEWFMGTASAPALSLGGGLNLRLNQNIDLFVEARYEIGFTNPLPDRTNTEFINPLATRHVPIRIGIAYN